MTGATNHYCSRGGRATASYSISPSASPPQPSRKSSIGFALEEEEQVQRVVSIVFVGVDRKSFLPKKRAKYEWDLNSSCIDEEKCEHVKSLLPRDLSAVCSWHFILTQTHSLLNGSLEGLLEGRNNKMLKEYQNLLNGTLKRLLELRSDHNVKQDNLSTAQTEERKTLPAPPPPPKPVDTHTSNFPVTFFSATFTH